MNATGITIPNRLEALAEVAALLDTLAARHHFDADAVADVQVALDEVLSNAVRHAWPGGGDHAIRVEFALRGRVLDVHVLDDGIAFDPLSVPPPDIGGSLRERSEGGLGIHFVRKLMDSIRHERTGGRNHLVLGKRVLP